MIPLSQKLLRAAFVLMALYVIGAVFVVTPASPAALRAGEKLMTVSQLPPCSSNEWGSGFTVVDAVALGDLHAGGGTKTVYTFCDGNTWLMAENPDAFAVLQTQTTRDGAYKVELADYQTYMRYEVFSTKVATGERKKISANKPPGTPPEGWDVSSFILSTDQSRVIYRSGLASVGDYILSSTPIYQQAAFRISGPTGGQVYPGYFAFAPASVVYETDLIPGGALTTWVVPVAGGVMPTLAIFLDGFESGSTGGWR